MSIIRVHNDISAILQEGDDRRLVRAVTGRQCPRATENGKAESIIKLDYSLQNVSRRSCFNPMED